MRKIALFLILLLPNFIYAQNEEKGFSFQGYARDFEGAALTNQTITVKFTIYPEGESVHYYEEQTVKTDAYGVFHAVVGSMNPVPFSYLNFAVFKYWLKVEVKVFGSEYVEISNTELLSVPYSKASEIASNGVPVGAILPFGGPITKIPKGFLPCDGRPLSKTDFPQLFDVIGTAWGANGGDFNAPDLRTMFLRGVASDLPYDPDKDTRFAAQSGGNTGNQVGSYQEDMTGAHGHTINDPGHKHSYKQVGMGNVDPYAPTVGQIQTVGTTNKSIEGQTENTMTGITINNSTGSETRPRNAYVWFIIRYY